MSLLNRLTRRRPDASILDPVLALNLSYVLHERSRSRAVRDAVAACRSHGDWLARLGVAEPLPIATVDGAVDSHIDVWLTATLGLYPWLPQSLRHLTGSDAPVVRVDAFALEVTTHPFFRADAGLSLAILDGAAVGVAGLVARPGRHDAHLSIAGSFAWTDERAAALREIERLIQRNVDQWLPERALWPAPAEELLAGEVL